MLTLSYLTTATSISRTVLLEGMSWLYHTLNYKVAHVNSEQNSLYKILCKQDLARIEQQTAQFFFWIRNYPVAHLSKTTTSRQMRLKDLRDQFWAWAGPKVKLSAKPDWVLPWLWPDPWFSQTLRDFTLLNKIQREILRTQKQVSTLRQCLAKPRWTWIRSNNQNNRIGIVFFPNKLETVSWAWSYVINRVLITCLGPGND